MQLYNDESSAELFTTLVEYDAFRDSFTHGVLTTSAYGKNRETLRASVLQARQRQPPDSDDVRRAADPVGETVQQKVQPLSAIFVGSPQTCIGHFRQHVCSWAAPPRPEHCRIATMSRGGQGGRDLRTLSGSRGIFRWQYMPGARNVVITTIESSTEVIGMIQTQLKVRTSSNRSRKIQLGKSVLYEDLKIQRRTDIQRVQSSLPEYVTVHLVQINASQEAINSGTLASFNGSTPTTTENSIVYTQLSDHHIVRDSHTELNKVDIHAIIDTDTIPQSLYRKINKDIHQLCFTDLPTSDWVRSCWQTVFNSAAAAAASLR
jgi:hypothetical protein